MNKNKKIIIILVSLVVIFNSYNNTQATTEQITKSTMQSPKITPSKEPFLGEIDHTVAN